MIFEREIIDLNTVIEVRKEDMKGVNLDLILVVIGNVLNKDVFFPYPIRDYYYPGIKN